MTKSSHLFHLSLALFLLLCAASFDWVLLSVRADSAAGTSSKRDPVSVKSDSLCLAEGVSQGIRDAVDIIRPSLVTISTASKSRRTSVLPPLLPEFSDCDYGPLSDSPHLKPFFRSNSDRSEVATGVIVSEDGFIWTSSGAVRNLDSVTVTLQNKTSHEGKVVLDDPESGLSIIKIDAEQLPAAHVEPKNPSLADWAVAVALNEQHEPIISAGLISSFIGNPESQSGMKRIQIASPISADVTGCAFVNLSGELIGIKQPHSSRVAGELNSCIAFDAESANQLQRKAVERTANKEQELRKQQSALDDSTTTQHFTQIGKEAALSKLEFIRDLFFVPRSEWTSATIASSVRSWLTSWQDANDPPTHPVSNASESR